MPEVVERAKSFFRKMPGIEKNVDEYLTDNLSNLLKAYKISRKKDLQGTMNDIEKKEETVEDLSKWQYKTKPKVKDLESRIKRLETKYGVK
ncbi:MAG: hypothetical protein U9R21_01830 [Candidatus Thermoplasmatota archaeon]|nr:hypothetical protein [Candidatus Thermoplasmatota archaeon]